MKKHHRRRSAGRRLCLFLICAVLFAGFLFWENTALQTTFFHLTFPDLPEGFDGCRIAVIADSHSAEFGEGNRKLFTAIEEQDPDYIFHLGDLEDSNRPRKPGYAESMADGLTAIAPTYYVTGNHEWANGGVPELKDCLRGHGVHVLSNQFVPLERNGDVLILAGIDDPNGRADQKTPEELAAEIREACGDTFWMMMAHRNNRFENQYSLLGADLVLAGHGHGGVIRLPFTDGLVDADRTLFPHYTAGVYELNGSTAFITRGLGNTGYTLRLFNRPEVAILTLHQGSAD